MKKSSKCWMMLIAVCVLCAVSLSMTLFEEGKEQIKKETQTILQMKAQDIQSVSWNINNNILSFHKDEEGKWIYDEDEAFPVDGTKLNQSLTIFEKFVTAFTIEEAEDLSQYNLDNPYGTITITTESEEITMSLGDYSELDSQRYVSIGDGNVYLAEEDPTDALEIDFMEYLLHDETISFDEVREIVFSGQVSYTIQYIEDSQLSINAEDVYFADELPLDTDFVEDVLDAITTLDLSDVVTYNATEEDLKSCGLLAPEQSIQVKTIKDEEEIIFTIHVGLDAEKRESEDADEENVPVYARIDDSKILYEISNTEYQDLTVVSTYDLCHQEVFYGDFEQVNQIEIELEDTNYILMKDIEEDEWFYQEKEIEIGTFQTTLENLSAESFTTKESTGKEEIKLTLHLDNESYPMIEIRLLRQDGSTCLAMVDGQPISIVSRTNVVDLIEAVHAIVL